MRSAARPSPYTSRLPWSAGQRPVKASFASATMRIAIHAGKSHQSGGHAFRSLRHLSHDNRARTQARRFLLSPADR